MNKLAESAARVEVCNIGGIDEAEVTLPPGVSVLTGRNATNRTSFLQALMISLGSNRSALKGDADEGSVTLEIGDETYTRTLTRRDGSVVFGGDPYLDDPDLADLFAFLLENNEARRAVARGDDLREIIMRPIDTDQIDAEIETCRRERAELEAEIERLEELERDLPKLETDRRETQAELNSAREELESLRDQLNELDTGVEESCSRKQELEEAFQRVRDARSELEDLEFDLETERSTLAELEAERDGLAETIAEADEPDGNLDRLAGRIDELRRRKRALDDTISELGSVISFNEEMLEGEGLDIDDRVGGDDPTEALTAGGETVCWTCGSEVDTDQIQSTLERLRELRSAKLDERSDVGSEINELTDQQSKIRNKQQELEQAEQHLSEVEAEIETTANRISDLEERIAAKEVAIEDLEAEVEGIDVEDHDEVLELHREANGIELRVGRLENDLAEIDEEIVEHEAAIEDLESLREEREELADRLTDLRTRVDRIEENAVEVFNDHMETVLDILEYDNLDRIWIERRETEVREGRRKLTRTRFDFHIVRSAADGTAYEDTVDHLSESEREVTGLVFALAGYLVHDIHEVVPFVVLDSLEAIDADRIARVVNHFRDHADYLVTALLPEDAAALPEPYAYIENID
ncbi:chromosome segregation protein SMC [Halobacteriales archaeon QS_4_62_28]|nr:MAG: chromosome segregation protein SMC [Halobacteriales archaeon QS_4_62_28]